MYFLSLFFATSVSAEYRVYQLKITDTQTNKSREVLSTLMPAAYIVYHPIRSTEMVEILDHWMCWERSDGFRPHCTRPSAGFAQSPKTGSEENTQAGSSNP